MLAGTLGFGVVSAVCQGAGLFALRIVPDGAPEWVSLATAAGATFVVLAAAGLFITARMSREVRRLRLAVEESAREGVPHPLHSSVWLAPLAEAMHSAMTAWSARCDAQGARIREAEIRLNVTEAEREYCEAILHSLRDAVLVTDPYNELTLANEPAARLLGFDLDGAVHKPIDDLVADETIRQAIKEVQQSGVASKERHLEHAMETRSAEGGHGRAAFDVTVASLPDRRHNLGGVVTILRDVTREKEISEMKSDFVSQASHELRTPLSSINAYIEMLIDAEAQDEASRQEFYQIIKAEADRVSRMIDNMLNISRIEAGIVSVEKSEVDFAKLAGEVIETMRAQAETKQIKLISKAGPLIYTAEADRDMMYQVVMNLVSNAVKYTPEGGRVTVAVENDDATRSVLVSVSDTGLGIPPDALSRLFEKFFRVENYKRIAKGTGLGLNLVKHIVETVHHGKVGVSSQVGMGSRFWFSVPYEFQGGDR